MDETKPNPPAIPATGKRRRGRPRKPRTEPPKVEEQVKPQEVNEAKPTTEKLEQVKPDQPVVDRPGRTITITIPVRELSDGNEYQLSKNNPPRQLRARPLTRIQGQALASILAGMTTEGAMLESGRADFYSGGRRSVAVETKEQAIAKLLDLVAAELENDEEKK